MQNIKDYKQGIKIALKRIRTGKNLTNKQYIKLQGIKDYLHTKNFKLENFDYHLHNNTKEYKNLTRLHIRFQILCQALSNNILVNFTSRQYNNIK